MLNSKEHYELMEQFEQQFHGRMEKETKSIWPRGNVYQDGHINQAFIGFRSGYAYGKAVERSEQVGPTIKESLTVGAGELVEVAKDAGWRDIESRPIESRSYLVCNALGHVAPWIDGVIHNAPGSDSGDWEWGEAITHWQPLPAPPVLPTKE